MIHDRISDKSSIALGQDFDARIRSENDDVAHVVKQTNLNDASDGQKCSFGFCRLCDGGSRVGISDEIPVICLNFAAVKFSHDYSATQHALNRLLGGVEGERRDFCLLYTSPSPRDR